MQNETALKTAFVSALGIDESAVVDGLEYNTIAEWDSIGHMRLIAEIEGAFDIMVETDDLLAMDTYKAAKEIVAKYVA
jgi:acyl carrier protein